MTRICFCAIALLGVAIAAAQQESSPLPELPTDIPKGAVVRPVLTDKTPSGHDAVWRTPDGALNEFFQFNDRGRGPKVYVTYRLDDSGLIVSEESKGVDYMKSPFEERFSLAAGNAIWKNQAETQKQSRATGKFYVDLNGGPEEAAILAWALLLPVNENKLPVLPAGSATIRKRQSLPVQANAQKRTVTLYEIGGLSYSPNYLWLTEDREFFASVSGWFAVIQPGFESAVPALPPGDLVITNTTLFDSENGRLSPSQRVTVRSANIAAVEADRGQPVAAGAQIIDGHGKMLLPGLWDMHAHLGADDAFLDTATGVTTVRDLGNSIDDLTKLRQQIDSGRQIGPRVVPAGFIDGPGPFEGPIKILAATPEEARARVDRYADLGYVQIKIYSSVKPELVPVIVEEAHKRGLRVRGHIPSGMTAEQLVRQGADEIQHMNFIFLNFMPDVKETRTPARFIEPGKRGADLDLNSSQVADFIDLLKQHHTVVDPTMGIWEATYLDRRGAIARIDAAMFDRLPVQVQRASKLGGASLGVSDAATDKRYRDFYANMLRMLKKLYDSGVQIVAGTDAATGYAFDRELEIYNEAGIPALQVLRMATIEAAKVMHREHDLGSVAPGKFADMILVNGDPAKNLSDIRRVDTVIKNGDVYRPSEMYPAFGIRAQ